TLAQGDHLLHVRTHRLGLDDRSLDALFHDDAGHQIAQQRAPMTGISSKFPTCYTMTHCFALFRSSWLPISFVLCGTLPQRLAPLRARLFQGSVARDFSLALCSR